MNALTTTSLRTSVLIATAAALPMTASATIVFDADFEGPTTGATIGTLNPVTGNVSNVAVSTTTPTVDPTNGDHVLLVDLLNPEFSLNLASTLDLTGSNTATFSFDVAARRTNGIVKTHLVTGLDSSGNEVFQLVLGDANAFGNGSGDRQRPGYAIANPGGTLPNNGRTTFLPGPSTPGSFWFGGDTNLSDNYDSRRDSDFTVTVGNGGWDLSTNRQDTASSYTTTGLPLFNGGPATDLASIQIVALGDGAGMYWDNFLVDGTPVPEPASAMLVMAGASTMLRRRRA